MDICNTRRICIEMGLLYSGLPNWSLLFVWEDPFCVREVKSVLIALLNLWNTMTFVTCYNRWLIAGIVLLLTLEVYHL